MFETKKFKIKKPPSNVAPRSQRQTFDIESEKEGGFYPTKPSP